MLGTEDSPSLHAKAAESHGLALFVHHLLEAHMVEFERDLPKDRSRKAKFLLEAARSATDLDNVFSAEARSFTREQARKAFEAYVRFLSFYCKLQGL